jgi:hypothetical protein
MRLLLVHGMGRTPLSLARLARFRRQERGQSGQLLARTEFFSQLPPPAVPYTIIAGTAGPRGRWSPFGQDPNDWLVAVDETKLAPGDRPMLLPVGHTFMMNDRKVHAAIRRALEQGAA